LKCQQVEGHLDLQKIFKPVPILNKKAKNWKKKKQLWWKTKMKKMKKLEIVSIVCNENRKK
jgi:hypothetical protein